MSKTVKKVILVLTIVIVVACVINILLKKSAENEMVQNELDKAPNYVSICIKSEDKMRFADEKDNLTIAEEMEEPLEDALFRKVILANSEDEIEAVLQEFEKYGLYKMEAPIDTRHIVKDIYLPIPYVFYNAKDKTWIVATSGMWIGDEWNKSIISKDLGQQSQFGVFFSEIEGKYDTIVMKSGACISDVNHKKYEMGEYRSAIQDENGNMGFEFSMQDYSYGFLKKNYVGEKWYGYSVYDSNFETFGGRLTARYIP